MADRPDTEGTRASVVIPLEVILQVLGAGGAIIAWIVVIGGARIWARLEAADIPASQTLAGLPRNLFIVEGLQTLLLPILVGASVALFVYFSRRDDERSARTFYAGAVPVTSRTWRSIRTVREYRNIHGTGETVALAILAAAGMLIIGLTVVQVDFGLLAALVVVTLVGAVVLLARGSGTLAAFVLILGLAVSVAIVVFDKVRFGYVVAMAVVTAAAVWLTL